MFQLPKVVLVHRASANAGCWSKLVPSLHAKGLAPTASHCPVSSLADDVAAAAKSKSRSARPGTPSSAPPRRDRRDSEGCACQPPKGG
jgi:hypothetical protein